MGVQDRDWYHEHRDKVAAADRLRERTRQQQQRYYQPTTERRAQLGVWGQFGLFVLICCAVVGALFLLVFFHAYWLR